MVGMALTGLVGYFTSMMALKDEISKNRESAAILKSELDSLKSDLEKAESEIKNGNSALRKAELLEVKLDNLNSRITEHTNNSRKN